MAQYIPRCILTYNMEATVLPINRPAKLELFGRPIRYNDLPVTPVQWKTAALVVQFVFFVFFIALNRSELAIIAIVPVLEYAVQVLNLRTGAWGNRESWFFVDVSRQIKEDNNVIRMLFTALFECIVCFILSGRFSGLCILIIYRLDALRRFYQKPKNTEQIDVASDLEALHLAQVHQDPVVDISILLHLMFALFFVQRVFALIHFTIRTLIAFVRDMGVVSGIQTELYSDVCTCSTGIILTVYAVTQH